MGKAKRKSSQSESVTPLLGPIQAVQNLIVQFNDQGVIIGGVATSLMGAPRYTVDVDVVILLGLEDLPQLIKAAAAQNIEPRIPDSIDFARKNRVLLLRHTPSGVDVDISLGVLPFELELIERSRAVELASLRVKLPTPEDLIILKAVAHRPKDLEDIQAVAASHPDIDKERIQFWVKQFGDALDLPDLWNQISQLL